jgi:L-rhamnose mutarotase
MCRTSPRHRPHAALLVRHPETRQLFGYAEIENEEQWAAIGATEICQKWWKHMGDVMPSNPDYRPVSAPLREVFHLG